ncbi:MAG TPA: TraR/DksA C4-type zinc finger protein [Candidatus Paceibacterota bacterium]|nr:TraR/DksA C4-type zinc finger protein [Candidatus Paceibacterota bacterium]
MKPVVTRRKAAATADIVGNRLRNPRVPAKWKPYYDRLIEVRKFLLSRQDELVRDAREETPSFSLHMADAGTDSFDRDLALSRAASEQDAVYEVDEALERIRDGSYGICELTGKPIETARLKAIPWTRFSRKAEEMLEKEGTVQRARLAPRDAVTRTAAGGSEGEDDEAE